MQLYVPFILYITNMSPPTLTPLLQTLCMLKKCIWFKCECVAQPKEHFVGVCVWCMCSLHIYATYVLLYIHTYILYFIYLYFLTTYSAPFERFNGHLLTNCKCFGLLCASAASAAAAVRWFSERNQSDVYNKFTVIYAYKNCTAINFRVCEGRSSGFACSDGSKKIPKSRVKCKKFFRVYGPQYTHTNKIPWSSLVIIQVC